LVGLLRRRGDRHGRHAGIPASLGKTTGLVVTFRRRLSGRWAYGQRTVPFRTAELCTDGASVTPRSIGDRAVPNPVNSTMAGHFFWDPRVMSNSGLIVGVPGDLGTEI
jgi:hypothetical protein